MYNSATTAHNRCQCRTSGGGPTESWTISGRSPGRMANLGCSVVVHPESYDKGGGKERRRMARYTKRCAWRGVVNGYGVVGSETSSPVTGQVLGGSIGRHIHPFISLAALVSSSLVLTYWRVVNWRRQRRIKRSSRSNKNISHLTTRKHPAHQSSPSP